MLGLFLGTTRILHHADVQILFSTYFDKLDAHENTFEMVKTASWLLKFGFRISGLGVFFSQESCINTSGFSFCPLLFTVSDMPFVILSCK